MTPVNKVAEGRPHIVDMIKNGEIALIINTVEEKRSAIQDSLRDPARGAAATRFPPYTTLAGARAACDRACRHARARPLLDAGAASAARLTAGPARVSDQPQAGGGEPLPADSFKTTMARIPMTVAGAERLKPSCTA